jgi:hypothetical protein
MNSYIRGNSLSMLFLAFDDENETKSRDEDDVATNMEYDEDDDEDDVATNREYDEDGDEDGNA